MEKVNSIESSIGKKAIIKEICYLKGYEYQEYDVEISDSIPNEWIFGVGNRVRTGYPLIRVGSMVVSVEDALTKELIYFNPRATQKNIPTSIDEEISESVKMFGRTETIKTYLEVINRTLNSRHESDESIRKILDL